MAEELNKTRKNFHPAKLTNFCHTSQGRLESVFHAIKITQKWQYHFIFNIGLIETFLLISFL